MVIDNSSRAAHNWSEQRVQALLAEGRPLDALGAARLAARAEPGSAGAHALVADALLAVGRRDDAARALERTVRLDPSRRDAYGTLCAVLRERGRHVEACAAHERASRLFPGDGWLHYYRGVALEFLARERPAESAPLRRRAIGAIRRAMRIDPHNPECGMALAHIEGRLRGEGGARG